MLENQENKGEKYTLLKFKLSFFFFNIKQSLFVNVLSNSCFYY